MDKRITCPGPVSPKPDVSPVGQEPVEPPGVIAPILIMGYTQDEIIHNLCRELSVRTGARVSVEMLHRERNMRNKPCPCGSGEKFKRCCEKAGKVVASHVDHATFDSLKNSALHSPVEPL